MGRILDLGSDRPELVWSCARQKVAEMGREGWAGRALWVATVAQQSLGRVDAYCRGVHMGLPGWQIRSPIEIGGVGS